MIDVLAELKSDDDEIPALTLLTTSNTIVGRDLCKYAEDRGVRLYQSVLYYDEETDEYMLSDPELKVSGVSFSKILENFSNWFTNYDNFDFFGKKDSAFLESMVTDYSSPSDPDPAKAE